MPAPKQEIVDDGIKEIPIPEPVPIQPPPPERSPSPVEEEVESEPLKYIEGVSKPYFHVNIKGTSHGGLLTNIYLLKYISSVLIYNYHLVNIIIDKIAWLNEKVLMKSIMNGGTLRVNLNQKDQ